MDAHPSSDAVGSYVAFAGRQAAHSPAISSVICSAAMFFGVSASNSRSSLSLSEISITFPHSRQMAKAA
jgi:hypothetical protein